MNTVIRKLTQEDLPKATEVFCKAFNSVGEMWGPEVARKRLEQYYNPQACWVALLDSEIIGVITCKVDNVLDHQELYIDVIAVNPDCHKTGIGAKLLQTAEEHAKKQGYKAVWLTASNKLPSFDWYLKIGFRETSWKALEKSI